MSSDPLEHIIYLSIPDDVARSIGPFEVDPAILIPVEVLPGEESWSLQNLSWEMIIAAMLKVLIYDPKHENVEYFRRFVFAVKPNIIEELSASGIEQAEKKSFDAAEELFAALKTLSPDDPRPPLNLALVYEEHAETYRVSGRDEFADEYRDAAFRVYTEVVRLFPDDAQTRFNAGHFFLGLNNYAKAQEHLSRFLELSQDEQKKEIVRKVVDEIDKQHSTDILFSEAYDFIKIGKEREGLERISAFIEVHPDVWNAWFIKGWAFRRLGEYEDGKIAFLRSLELGDEQVDTLNEVAICYMELNEFTESREALERALRIEPENVKIISNLGILALKQKRPDEATGYFKTVLDIDPDDTIAGSYLARLKHQ